MSSKKPSHELSKIESPKTPVVKRRHSTKISTTIAIDGSSYSSFVAADGSGGGVHPSSNTPTSICSAGSPSAVSTSTSSSHRVSRRSHAKSSRKYTSNDSSKLDPSMMPPILLPPAALSSSKSNTNNNIIMNNYRSPLLFAARNSGKESNMNEPSSSSGPQSIPRSKMRNNTNDRESMQKDYDEKRTCLLVRNKLPKPKRPQKCSLFCVFYAEFDIKVGPKICFQSPQKFMDNDITISIDDIHKCLSDEFRSFAHRRKSNSTKEHDKDGLEDLEEVDTKPQNSGHKSMSIFDSTSDYIITGNELTGHIVSLSTHDMHIVSRPTMIINANRYERNSLLFSVGFVIRRIEDPMPFRPMLSKLASTLHSMEVESQFLSHPTKRNQVQLVLECVLFSLNSKSGECNLLLDHANAIHLKYFKPPKPITPPVPDHVVPVLLRPDWQLQMFDWDLTINLIVQKINGLKYTALIAESSKVDLEMVRACLRVLKHHGVLTFIDIFRYSNIYECTPLASRMLAGKESKLIDSAFEFCSKKEVQTIDSPQIQTTGSPLLDPSTHNSNMSVTSPPSTQHLLDVSNHRYFVPPLASMHQSQQQQQQQQLDNILRKNNVLLHHSQLQHNPQQMSGNRIQPYTGTPPPTASPSSFNLGPYMMSPSNQYRSLHIENMHTDSINSRAFNSQSYDETPIVSSFPPTLAMQSNQSVIDNSHENRKEPLSRSFSSREGHRPSSYRCPSTSTCSVDNNKREENRPMLKMALAEIFCACNRTITFGELLISKLRETSQRRPRSKFSQSNDSNISVHTKDPKSQEWDLEKKGGERKQRSDSREFQSNSPSNQNERKQLREQQPQHYDIDWNEVFEYFDHRRLISFGIIHGLIKRVHEYPWAYDKISRENDKIFPDNSVVKDEYYSEAERMYSKHSSSRTGSSITVEGQNNASTTHSKTELPSNQNPAMLKKLAKKVSESMDGSKCDDELCCIYRQPLDSLKQLVTKYENKSITSLYSTCSH